MKRYVICAIDVEGFHRWPGAPDNLDYLRDRHRHIFQIRMEFEVSHGDREIEINERQSQVKRFLLAKYASADFYQGAEGACEFGAMSCEQIAEELLDKFGAASCKVLEDGYGGAKIVR
ncbi:MAG: hypothetical protein K2O18_16400 [Oscillospiraceae bacterium]|nr:hypothetical protein [Oscillospiraceae bacterium]